jgi:hypothetical protein
MVELSRTGGILVGKICQWRRASSGSEETLAHEALFDELRGGHFVVGQAAGLRNL